MSTTPSHRGVFLRTTRQPSLRAAGLLAILLGIPAWAAAPDQTKAPQPAKVKVNKTVPTVTPPPLALELSDSPTDAELFRARIFTEPLVPVGGATTPEENAALARALEEYVAGGASDRTAPLEAFLRGSHVGPWRSLAPTRPRANLREDGPILPGAAGARGRVGDSEGRDGLAPEGGRGLSGGRAGADPGPAGPQGHARGAL